MEVWHCCICYSRQGRRGTHSASKLLAERQEELLPEVHDVWVKLPAEAAEKREGGSFRRMKVGPVRCDYLCQRAIPTAQQK